MTRMRQRLIVLLLSGLGAMCVAWARVLHALATGDEPQAKRLLKAARKLNQHVEQYMTGQKRRPRSHPEMYSPGDEREAIICADILWSALTKHPKAKQWLKSACGAGASGPG